MRHHHIQQKNTIGRTIILLFVFLNAIVLEEGFVSHKKWYWMLLITLPLLLLSVALSRSKAKTKPHNHPIPETGLDLNKISFQ